MTAYSHEWRKLTAQARRLYPPVCHLCHQPIDLTLPREHRNSWTLDHLDPIVKVGEAIPSLDRVRPAHRRCNSRRGGKDIAPSPRSRVW